MAAISETYGEILYQSIDKLLNIIKLTQNDIFIDLGSGMGKVVMQTFFHTPVKAAYGIEIKPELHQKALSMQSRLKEEFPEKFENRNVGFIQEDFLNADFKNATVTLIASPCYGPSILNPLGNRLNETSSIHTVLSLRPLPTLNRLLFKKIIRVECSWDAALCYYYSLLK